ncbi:hypothetical protein [Leuconostoc citreum]|uniref:hypothetical protein n=1 Tax=Leuconostoc citreum TaxID=33964 RepID=UPI000BFF0D34|nr:hypothetical protein [Leuconostoc citreum]
MDKIKKNKMWLTVVGFGIVIVIILLMLLNQENGRNNHSQTNETVNTSSSTTTSLQAKYAKKASHMSGHVIVMPQGYVYTTWTKKDIENWVKQYGEVLSKDNSQTFYHDAEINEQKNRSEKFGTNYVETGKKSLDNKYSSLTNPEHYYWSTVADFNKDYPDFNPDDIKK